MNPVFRTKGPGLHELTDLELIGLTRSGDDDAYAVLWDRHRDAGLRAARSITARFDPEDMLQEAFTRMLAAIQGNAGPQEVFRPYLYSVLRSISINWTPAGIPTVPIENVHAEPSYSFEGESLEKTITSRAFATLKPEWRRVLWYVEVEGMTPREIAPLLGMKANAISALAYRAKEGLRVSWLQAHVNSEAADPNCKWYVERLGAYNRGTLSAKATDQVEDHLTSCTKCSILVEEVDHLGRNLGLVLLPVFLGPTAIASFVAPPSTEGPIEPKPRSNSAHRLLRGRGVAIGLAASAVAAASLIWVTIAMAPGQDVIVTAPTASAPAGLADPPASTSPPAIPLPIDTEGLFIPEPAPDAGPDPHDVPGLFVPPIFVPPMALDVAFPLPPAPSPAPNPGPAPTPPPAPVPEVLASPAITTIAEQEEGLFLPVVSGTGVPGAQVAIMADSKQVALVLVGADGTWSTTPELTPGPDVRLSAYQTKGDLKSVETTPSAPLKLKIPVIHLVTEDSTSAQVNFSGIIDATVEAMLDGVPTGNYHVLTDKPLLRTVSNLTPGQHTLALRYVDKATGRHGASVTIIINKNAT